MMNFFEKIFKPNKICISDDAPQYIKNYVEKINHVERNSSQQIANTRFVVFDTETTGIDANNDKLLSIGALSILNNQINVSDSFEFFIKQEEIVGNEAIDVHGILKKGKKVKIPQEDAIAHFLEFCGTDILVGHHVGFDIAMINSFLEKKYQFKLKNNAIDTGLLYQRVAFLENYNTQFLPENHTLDGLAKHFNIETIDRHRALGDAYITGLIFIKLLSQLKKRKILSIKDLMNSRLY